MKKQQALKQIPLKTNNRLPSVMYVYCEVDDENTD